MRYNAFDNTMFAILAAALILGTIISINWFNTTFIEDIDTALRFTGVKWRSLYGCGE